MTVSEPQRDSSTDPFLGVRVPQRRKVTRVGYVGLTDAAPFFIAKDLGIFERHGLEVVLTREVGWATIREKIMFGELEAAHALCSLPFCATAGINSVPTKCVSGLILSRGGNAIVLSKELWKRGVRDERTLKLDIENRKFFRKYILASVFPQSTHAFLLREWLERAGIDPEADVQMVTLPPSQMCRNLAAGTIDGFCSGNPWTSLAIEEGIGWSPAVSVDVNPDHPEKVLMVNESFARLQEEEHVSLIAALIEACALCDDPTNRDLLASVLSGKRRVNCSPELLKKCLSPNFDYGNGRVESKPGQLRFFTGEANRPGKIESAWIVDRMKGCGVKLTADSEEELKSSVFREDIFNAARLKVDLKAARLLLEKYRRGE